MADFQRNSLSRDYEQAITTLKKGMFLLKYGRWGEPKFCPFRLSNDEKSVIWYTDKEEKQLKLSHVSRIIPGQQTAIFQRCPQPDKEHQSFSLIYNNRSLDLDPRDIQIVPLPYESTPQHKLGRAFSEVLTYTSITKALTQTNSVSKHVSSLSLGGLDNSFIVDSFRSSLSSAVSSSNQGSSFEDFDALGNVFIWGEGTGNGLLGGNVHRTQTTSVTPRFKKVNM